MNPADTRALLVAVLQRVRFSGQPELLAQAHAVEIVGGPATFPEFSVPDDAPRADLPDGPAPLSIDVDDADGASAGELIVWLVGGRLDALEYAWWSDETPERMPPPGKVRVATTSVGTPAASAAGAAAPDAAAAGAPGHDLSVPLADAVLQRARAEPIPLLVVHELAAERQPTATDAAVRQSVLQTVRQLVTDRLVELGEMSDAGFETWSSPLFQFAGVAPDYLAGEPLGTEHPPAWTRATWLSATPSGDAHVRTG